MGLRLNKEPFFDGPYADSTHCIPRLNPATVWPHLLPHCPNPLTRLSKKVQTLPLSVARPLSLLIQREVQPLHLFCSRNDTYAPLIERRAMPSEVSQKVPLAPIAQRDVSHYTPLSNRQKR